MEVQITNIEPTGSFDSNYGKLYSFKYTYGDNQNGVSNHKSESSPFNVGDTVEREANGQMSNGTNKFKIKRPETSQVPGLPAQQNFGGGGDAPKNAGGGNRFQPKGRDGMQVGNAVNNAVQLLANRAIIGDDGKPVTVPFGMIKETLWKVVSDILSAVDQIEAGNLHGRPVDVPKGSDAYENKRPSNAEFDQAAAKIVYEDAPPAPEQPAPTVDPNTGEVPSTPF